jgi:hypothetical protein
MNLLLKLPTQNIINHEEAFLRGNIPNDNNGNNDNPNRRIDRGTAEDWSLLIFKYQRL